MTGGGLERGAHDNAVEAGSTRDPLQCAFSFESSASVYNFPRCMLRGYEITVLFVNCARVLIVQAGYVI